MTLTFIVAKCSVDFRECIATGCRDITWREDGKASFVLTIDKETGDGDVEQDFDSPIQRGEYY